MVEMKNLVKEADTHPGVGHLSLWRTDLAYYWVINCEAGLQDDMHYHDNDDHIFMCVEGECTVRTPHKAFVLKQFDTVLLQSGESYQLCNTGTGRMILLRRGQQPCRRQAAHPRAEDPQPHADQRTDRRIGRGVNTLPPSFVVRLKKREWRSGLLLIRPHTPETHSLSANQPRQKKPAVHDLTHCRL